MSEVKKTGPSGTIPFSEDHFSYDTNGNLTLATRRSGTEIEAKTESYSRVGNRIDRLLIADEDEDPDQFTYDMNGAVTYDGNAHCWITNNVLGIVGEMLFEDGSFRGNRYLADGTKFACIDNDDYGTGLVYRGSMVYRSDWDEDLEDYAEHFESAAHPEGRFFAESFTPSGQSVLNSWHYVTDQIGSTVALVDMDMMAAEDEDAASERNEFSAYGSRIGDPTLPRDPDNRYRFNGKEEVEDTPAPYIDYGARVYSPTIRQWLSPDPLADKYPDISPYAFCADDPVNRVDPDGRDGIMTGSGTEDDPYVVTANYYYQKGSLNSDTIFGLNSAIEAYNNHGKTRKIKTSNGEKVYVRFSLSANEVEDPNDAALNDWIKDENGNQIRYGNVVDTKANPDNPNGDELGSANYNTVSINLSNIESSVNEGLYELDRVLKGTFVHEVGHNLGLDHSDKTAIMDIVNSTIKEQNGQKIILTSYPRIDNKGIGIMITRSNPYRIPGLGAINKK